jgi:flagellar biosynthesis component FlhA
MERKVKREIVLQSGCVVPNITTRDNINLKGM